MNEENIKKLKNLDEYLKKSELDKNLPLYEVLQSINETLKNIAEKEMPAMPEMPAHPEVVKMEMQGVSVLTLKGDQGEKGEQGERGFSGTDGKDGKDGKDGVDGLNGLDGKDGADGKDGENGKDGSPDTAEQIIEKINESEEGKIKREKVEGLDEELTAIRNLPRGGGTSALAVRQAFKYIFHTEEPVGDIDGANTTYTVANDIWAVIGFTLNGESIAELPNYTYAKRTITFSTALPAAYSGKDFEVKYIG